MHQRAEPVYRGGGAAAAGAPEHSASAGVELAPLMQSRQARSTRHVATDATRPGYMIDS